MICAPHQVNFLPGVSVMTKLAAADIFIACDEMQFPRYGFTARNRFSDGAWMTVPIDHRDLFAPINRVRIADRTGRHRAKIARTLMQRMGDSAEPFVRELERPWALLAGLNVALLRRLCDALEIRAEWVFQSHLAAGRHWGPATSEDAAELVTVSERLAAMTEEVGGTIYLSGPSGRNYLDETPFRVRDIEVRYWVHEGPNPTALELLRVGV